MDSADKAMVTKFATDRGMEVIENSNSCVLKIKHTDIIETFNGLDSFFDAYSILKKKMDDMYSEEHHKNLIQHGEETRNH